jgi:CBS domain-containing protein
MAAVADAMRSEFITVAPEDTLGEVADRMVEEKKGGAVVVMDYGRMIGILTERDMLRAMAGRVHTSDARVREWMTEEPITVPPETSLDEASQLMLEKNFRHLPVVEGGRIVGVVSLRRVVAAMQSRVAAHGGSSVVTSAGVGAGASEKMLRPISVVVTATTRSATSSARTITPTSRSVRRISARRTPGGSTTRRPCT